jgi:DNA replication protein DnaC
MNDQLKRLGLTQLARVLPTLLDEARAQQLSYDAFLRQALDAELGGRQQRALERRMRAAHVPRRVRLDAFDFSFQPSLSERLVRE